MTWSSVKWMPVAEYSNYTPVLTAYFSRCYGPIFHSILREMVEFGQPTRTCGLLPFTTAGSHFKAAVEGTSPSTGHILFLPTTMSESPHPRNPVLSRPAFTGRVSSPLSRPHFPWTTYLHRLSVSPAPTGASANWDSASTISNTSQTNARNPSLLTTVPQYNEESNMRQWTFTV
jgi:hypothetical protein